MLETLKVLENMFCFFVSVAQSKRYLTSCFVSFKTVLTTESKTTKATTQATATEASGKSTLGFQSVLFAFAFHK